jgi:hypothetical protein
MKLEDALPKAIRTVEKQVLDRHHLEEPLLQRDQREALVYLQRSYAHAIRDHLNVESQDRRSWSQFFGMLNLGFDQAVRWAMRHCSSESAMRDSIPDFKDLDLEADKLIGWGTDYTKLCMDHTAASRRFYTASIDEDARTISFAFPQDSDHSVLLGQLAAQSIHAQSQVAELPNALLSQLFESWVRGVDLTKIRVASDLPDIWGWTHHHCYVDVKKWIDTQIFPEIEETTQLRGFTVANLRKFWAHLLIATRMMTDLERAVDARCGPSNDLGSVILEGPTDEFCSMLAGSWDLPGDIVQEIVALLTFDSEVGRDGLNSSVFLQTAQKVTHLVCWKAQLSDPGTVTSRALARKSKSTYDALITTIEQRSVSQVASQLEHHGLVSILGRKIETEDGAIHPDFWLYEPLTSTLIVCDYKHALPPFGPGEVANRLGDLEAWLGQIRKYIKFVASHRSHVACALKLPHIVKTEGLLLFRWALPVPATAPNDVILADWPTLRTVLDNGIMIGVAELRRFFGSLRQASPETSGEMVAATHDIIVGDWTYRHPTIAWANPATGPLDRRGVTGA